MVAGAILPGEVRHGRRVRLVARPVGQMRSALRIEADAQMLVVGDAAHVVGDAFGERPRICGVIAVRGEGIVQGGLQRRAQLHDDVVGVDHAVDRLHQFAGRG